MKQYIICKEWWTVETDEFVDGEVMDTFSDEDEARDEAVRRTDREEMEEVEVDGETVMAVIRYSIEVEKYSHGMLSCWEKIEWDEL